MPLINIYAPSGIASRFLEEKLRELQEKIDRKTIIIGELKLSLSELDKFNLKINKTEVKELNKTLYKVDMTDLWRILNGDIKEYTLFSVVHGT